MQRAAVMLVVIALAGTTPAVGADGSKSAPIAHRLATVLAERHLDAIAAADPSSPDRFVAALLYPDVQLLVVDGRYAAPETMRAQIAAHQYKDVYLALIGSSAAESRLFFQDLKADGLHAEPDSGVDVMYEHVDKQTVFDGTPDRKRFDAADEEYSRLLSLLVTEASAQTSSAPAGGRRAF